MTKVYGGCSGFDISMESSRCIHVPTDRDLCLGRISECRFISRRDACPEAGGITFCLTFPAVREYLKISNRDESGP